MLKLLTIRLEAEGFEVLTAESAEAALQTLRNHPVELVITGRGADARVIDKADLVTEMKAVKHYYQDGVAARVGIEK